MMQKEELSRCFTSRNHISENGRSMARKWSQKVKDKKIIFDTIGNYDILKGNGYNDSSVQQCCIVEMDWTRDERPGTINPLHLIQPQVK